MRTAAMVPMTTSRDCAHDDHAHAVAFAALSISQSALLLLSESKEKWMTNICSQLSILRALAELNVFGTRYMWYMAC